jgi:uncharacterized damage-inducible protein DinB
VRVCAVGKQEPYRSCRCTSFERGQRRRTWLRLASGAAPVYDDLEWSVSSYPNQRGRVQFDSIPVFLEYFGGIRARTRRAVAAVPPDALEWSPGDGRWTFGDVARHIATSERYMFTENALGRPSRYPGHGRELADGHDAVLELMDRLHGESVELLSALEPAELQQKCTTPAGTQITVWKWLRAMIEHEVHHRGQIHLMLSLSGATSAPLFGLTEEQVRERSAQPVQLPAGIPCP